MRVILTGGIASGKSTVVEILKRHDIIVVDSDIISKNIFTRNIPTIQKMFDTHLTGLELRKYVGNIIFSNPKMKMQLEMFMHPKIKNVIKTRERELKGQKFVIDSPLYFETKQHSPSDYVLLVSIPYDLQLNRLMTRNNFTKIEADKRILSQLPTAIKAKKSNCIIDNSKDIKFLELQVLEMIENIFNG